MLTMEQQQKWMEKKKKRAKPEQNIGRVISKEAVRNSWDIMNLILVTNIRIIHWFRQFHI